MYNILQYGAVGDGSRKFVLRDGDPRVLRLVGEGSGLSCRPSRRSGEEPEKKGDPEIRVEGKGIALLSMKRIGAETVIRLYNADCEKKKATLRVAGDQMEFSFNPYEVKSAVYGAHGLQPCEPWKA